MQLIEKTHELWRNETVLRVDFSGHCTDGFICHNVS
jgi:hypothetical protein